MMSTARLANAPNVIRERHRTIARLMVAGWTNKAIARHLGVSEGHISVLNSSPLFKELIVEMRAEANEMAFGAAQARKDEVDLIAQAAFDVLKSWLVDDKGELKKMLTLREAKVQADIARDMLDRAGIRAPAQHQEVKDEENRSENILRGIYAELMAGPPKDEKAARTDDGPASPDEVN